MLHATVIHFEVKYLNFNELYTEVDELYTEVDEHGSETNAHYTELHNTTTTNTDINQRTKEERKLSL